MHDSRSVLAFVFGIVGGVLILVTLAIFFPLFFLGQTGPPIYGVFGFFIGAVAGLFVILGAAMTFVRPSGGVAWGIVMVVFAALSGFALAGFGVGMALGIAGGALAIVVRAGAGPGSALAAAAVRACTACGRLFALEFPHRPHCGAAAGAGSPNA